jgi:hypothetical protein
MHVELRKRDLPIILPAILVIAILGLYAQEKSALKTAAASKPAPAISAELELDYYKAHSAALEAQQQVEQTPQWKAAEVARQGEQEAIQKLIGACGGPASEWQPTQQEKKLVCVAKPKPAQAQSPQAPQPTPPQNGATK